MEPQGNAHRAFRYVRGRNPKREPPANAGARVEGPGFEEWFKRNRERFPEDFTFRLTREEAAAIADSRSQSVILKRGENIKYLPYVYDLNGAKRWNVWNAWNGAIPMPNRAPVLSVAK